MRSLAATRYDLRVLSLGAGVQSSALYLMALDGLITPRPDFAVFADTQQEPPWVYENLWRLCEEGSNAIPIRIATVGDLGATVVTKTQSRATHSGRFASVPFWVKGQDGRAAPGRRQCTREYKIDAVKRETRKALGLRHRQRAAGKYVVEEWIGISMDEASRAKPSRDKWRVSRWPFLYDLPMRRDAISRWLHDRGWPVVKKSACVFCPWRQPWEYAKWRDDEPELFAAACRWDDKIRDASNSGFTSEQYLTRLLIPLRDLPPWQELKQDNSAQLNLFENECEGMCGL